MTEEEAYQTAINQPLEVKVDKAVALYKHYERAAKTWDMFEPWYHVCQSGGKDSAFIEWLAERAGVDFKSYHNLTTLDAPELIHHMREHYPNTIIHKPERPLLRQMVEKEGQGPPTRLARWCCELYKENGCKGQIKVFGVRAQESNNRKQNWRLWTPRKQDRSWVLNPGLYFTDANVWALIHQENIPYCSVYDEVDAEGKKMFTRMGCIGCPMAGTCGRQKEFERWPKYRDAWQKHFAMFWEKWHGVPTLKPRWVSTEGKYPFCPLPSERKESRFVTVPSDDPHGQYKTVQELQKGFWTYRRWYDLREFTCWQDLWLWWMQMEDEPEGCTMGLF